MAKKLSIFFSIILFLTNCKKEDNAKSSYLKPPSVHATNSGTITLPTSTANLTGNATSYNGKIVGYLWSLISGPMVPTISSPSSANTVVSNLMVSGIYKFQFAAIDSAGLTGVDTTSIIVLPNPNKTLTLQPNNNPTEGHVDSYFNSAGIDVEVQMGAWTKGGTPFSVREIIKFDLTQIPSSSTVLSANLILYAMPNPISGDLIHAHYGTSNSCMVQRITSNWSFPTMTWANQPATTTTNQVSIPQSISGYENANINVTNLVQDMLSNTNYGFKITMLNENYYNIQQYASSYYSDSTIHPKLVINYK